MGAAPTTLLVPGLGPTTAGADRHLERDGEFVRRRHLAGDHLGGRRRLTRCHLQHEFVVDLEQDFRVPIPSDLRA